MKVLSLGVVASTFAIICVSAIQVTDFGASLTSFDSLIPVNSQIGGTQVDSLKRRAKLSRRKLADAISGHQSIHFTRRGHEEHESDENEPNGTENEKNESEADENEHFKKENEVNEQNYVREATVSSNANTDQTENEPKEVEASEREPNSLEDEFKEPNENENEPKENEPQENEREPKEHGPQENENEPNEHEAKENENEPKEHEPEENELYAVGEDINTTGIKASESNVAEDEVSTGSKSVQLQSYEAKGHANVREQQSENNTPAINRLDVVNSLYGGASDNDLVYYGVKTPVFDDNVENDAQDINRVFHSSPEDSLMEDVPYEYKPVDNKASEDTDYSIKNAQDIESLPIDQLENTDVISLEAPAYYPPLSVEYESPINDVTTEEAPVDSTKKDDLQVESKPLKALENGPGFSYSVSGHEVYSEDGDEFESLQDQMENMLEQLYENKHSNKDN